VRLTRLEISGVRNLSSISIACNAGLNLFVGVNGAGKTAILESIFLLARGRSFRAGSLSWVIQRGVETLRVTARLADEQRGEVGVRVVKGVGGGELMIDGRAGHRLSEIARLIPIQLILPDASELILGGPEERRKYLDWGTFHVEPSYLKALQNYQRAVQQRNAALREAQSRMGAAENEIDVWTARVAQFGMTVDDLRKRYLIELVPAIVRQINAMAPSLDVRCSYHAGWPDDTSLADSLRESRARDVNSAVTHRGPHRADLRVEIDSERASTTVSRGQAKIIASAMRLAQAEVTAELGQRRSLFLIDDVGAELDHAHNERFFAALERLGCQVFATATVAPSNTQTFGGNPSGVFHVEQGLCWPIAN
jgi:DNA replication and repair protein RecF